MKRNFYHHSTWSFFAFCLEYDSSRRRDVNKLKLKFQMFLRQHFPATNNAVSNVAHTYEYNISQSKSFIKVTQTKVFTLIACWNKLLFTFKNSFCLVRYIDIHQLQKFHPFLIVFARKKTRTLDLINSSSTIVSLFRSSSFGLRNHAEQLLAPEPSSFQRAPEKTPPIVPQIHVLTSH